MSPGFSFITAPCFYLKTLPNLEKMKVLLNIATHGDEKIGLKVVEAIKKIKITNGLLVANVANKRAFRLGKRFIDQDLNRSFPGSSIGNYEERLAYKLSPIINSADVVVDIHSTTSNLKNAIIVTRLNKKIKECIRAISPDYVLLMTVTKKNALISNAKIGIAFEYGSDNDDTSLKNTLVGVKRLLTHLKMINGSCLGGIKTTPTFFNVYKMIPKPKGAKLDKNTKNCVLVKKGQEYAKIGDKSILADENFYPILFGERKYKDIFGFAAKKLALSGQ